MVDDKMAKGILNDKVAVARWLEDLWLVVEKQIGIVNDDLIIGRMKIL